MIRVFGAGRRARARHVQRDRDGDGPHGRGDGQREAPRRQGDRPEAAADLAADEVAAAAGDRPTAATHGVHVPTRVLP